MRRNRGSAIVEAALLMPWLAFLFIGVFDFGFYAYAAICVQNAARAVAVSQAISSTASMCTVALGELASLPNVGASYSSCANQSYPSGLSSTSLMSVCVASLSTAGASDTNCTAATTCADCSLDASSTSVQATVGYRTIQLVPLPFLVGQTTITRTAEMKVIQ